MREVTYILFGSGFTVLSAVALGRLLIIAFRLRLEPIEVWLFSFLLGSAAWSLAMFTLAATGLVYKGAILAMGLAAIALATYYTRNGATRVNASSLGPYRFLLLALPFFILYLANAMAPEMSPDGSSYHLGLVSRYYRMHGFERHYENMYAHLSQGFEMLFLSAWAFGRNSAAAMVHFAMQCALPLLMVAYARRFGFATAGIAAALLVYFSPVYGIDGISAYNDVAGAAVVFGVFYLCELWDETPSTGLAVAIGLLAGYAFAIKYTLGLAIPYALARIWWNSRRMQPVAIAASASCILALPWLVKSAILTGNPLAPFFNHWFPNPYVTASFERDYRYYMQHYDGLGSYWQIPLEVTIRGRALGGFLGPIWLAAPIGFLALRNPRGRALLLAALIFAATYVTNVGTRFLLPALPFAALAVAIALVRLPWLLALIVAAHGITSWPDVNKLYSNSIWRLDRIWWKQALRIEPADAFLHRRLANYSAARLIEEKVPPNEPALTFNQEAEAYTTREIRTWYESAENSRLGDLLHAPLMPEAAPRRRIEFRLDHPVEGTTIRIEQTARHDVSQWHVNEFLIYGDQDVTHPIPRKPSWRIQSTVQPWSIAEAFDNDALTRWDSGEPLRPGQPIELQIDRGLITRVVLESPELESDSRYRLTIQDGARVVADSSVPIVYAAPVPLGMRRIATRAIARHGIHWILIGDKDFGAEDYFTRRADWGLELVGEASGRRLYRIAD